jgi:hypothetical protein
MTPSQDPVEVSIQQLMEIAANVLQREATFQKASLSPEVIQEVVVHLTACLLLDPGPDRSEQSLVTIAPDLYEGSSIKAENLFLDMRKLFVTTAEMALGILGSLATPWALLLVGIVALDSYSSILKVDLSEQEAVVLWTMWQRRDQQNCLPQNDLWGFVNDTLTQKNRGSLSPSDLDRALNRLREVKCIERLPDRPGIWRVRERVRLG